MSLHPIVEKLRAQFSGTPDMTEPLVLYLLVGIRKLLELEKSHRKYPGLKFQCDWCLHTQMDRQGAIEVIKLFDELEDMRRADGGVTLQQTTKLMKAFGVDSLRQDLQAFSHDHKIPLDLTDHQRWTSFLEAYGGIIQDVPLEFKLIRVRHVSKVVVKKTLTEKGRHYVGGRFLFALEWEITRFDGKNVEPYRMNFLIPNPSSPIQQP